MANDIDLDALVGHYEGTSQLFLDPTAPPDESPSKAELQRGAHGAFTTLRYTWSYKGKPQEGVLVVVHSDEEASPGNAAWTDSWHMTGKLMVCDLTAADDAALHVVGSYAAPPGPDWGWRVLVRAVPNGGLVLEMKNVSPEGEVYPAVHAVYTRAL